jgi:hypothetical protein
MLLEANYEVRHILFKLSFKDYIDQHGSFSIFRKPLPSQYGVPQKGDLRDERERYSTISGFEHTRDTGRTQSTAESEIREHRRKE